MGEVFRSWSMKGGVTLTNEEGDILVGNPTFSQTAHGFVVGDILHRFSALLHAKAQADTIPNIGQGLALVVAVATDGNSFSVLRTNSNHTVNIEAHGLGVFGTEIFLSTTDKGEMTATGIVGSRVYLGFVIDDDHIHWEPGWTRY